MNKHEMDEAIQAIVLAVVWVAVTSFVLYHAWGTAWHWFKVICVGPVWLMFVSIILETFLEVIEYVCKRDDDRPGGR